MKNIFQILTLFALQMNALAQSGMPKEIKINNQIWAFKNLNVSTFQNGDTIPEAKSSAEWIAFSTAKEPAWCYYDNDPANGEKYGKLYNWYAVSDPRGLAPDGWHIPTNDEWVGLVSSLGGGQKASAKLKSKNGWFQGGNGTNSSGFNALPGGFRTGNGHFLYNGFLAYWWTASDYKTDAALNQLIHYNYEKLQIHGSTKDRGNFVRCVKNESGESNLGNYQSKNSTAKSNIEELNTDRVFQIENQCAETIERLRLECLVDIYVDETDYFWGENIMLDSGFHKIYENRLYHSGAIKGSFFGDHAEFKGLERDSKFQLCLNGACPFFYYLDKTTNSFIYGGEIIRNQNSKERNLLDSTVLKTDFIHHGCLTLKISEEKKETSYLDRIFVIINDKYLINGSVVKDNRLNKSLIQTDDHYNIMNYSDSFLIKFKIPKQVESVNKLVLYSKGYYLKNVE